ncbi:uncharacterized protein A4U43_C05F32000 [Asparagus officinalis]|uniref:Uncharacterized protein n=1 Tax=Asparagus officinalis TaxID=4686 RepID=A0A5P1F1G4_ASPOF|nr:uncharacterized protein A4U43_C05F32000 [Asparagus officinalis]
MVSKIHYSRRRTSAAAYLTWTMSSGASIVPPMECVDQSQAHFDPSSLILSTSYSPCLPITSHFVLSRIEHRRVYESVLVSRQVEGGEPEGEARVRFGAQSVVPDSGLLRDAVFRRRVRKTHCDRNCNAGNRYKIWWYYSGARRIPFLGNAIASDMAACALEIASWLYRTSMFLLVCVIFRVICYLQILRLQDFATVFQEESDAAAVLQVHLKIRRQLRVISHRFRKFIVAVVILVTGSQFATILLTTRPRAEVNVFNNGEIALCSVVLVTGLLITVSSAVKITHKAQAVTSLAAKWHACATIDSFDADLEAALTCEIVSSDCVVPVNVSVENDQEPEEVEGTDEDDLESMEIVQPHAHSISFQKRQALVTYLENNRAGITVYGFMLDRTCLHMVFMVELSLFLWLLGKTIGIS